MPDGYELIEPLGRGGNAKVARVRHDGQEFALKPLVNNYKEPNSPTFKRFGNEIRVLKQLLDDAGVMPVIKSNLWHDSRARILERTLRQHDTEYQART